MTRGGGERLADRINRNTLEMAEGVTRRIQAGFDGDGVRSMALAHLGEALFVGAVLQIVKDVGPDAARERLELLLEKISVFLTTDRRRVRLSLDWREEEL